jgi:transposase
MAKKNLSKEQKEILLETLRTRFSKNMSRHKNMEWNQIEKKLLENPEKLWSLNEMEITEGEPDVVSIDITSSEILFFDCSPESPKRRSLCYDYQAWNSRKANKPEGNAIDKAAEMGIEILTEEQYRKLQELGKFDLKTSSWIQTPEKIRQMGGAVFCDRRYDTVFLYHNGAESYYAARGFRGCLKI